MFKVYGLYSYIRSNRIRSAFLICGLFGVFYAVLLTVHIVGLGIRLLENDLVWTPEQTQLAWHYLKETIPTTTGIAIVWFVVGWIWHKWFIAKACGAVPLKRVEYPVLYNILENLCISCGAPIPELAIIDSPALNAFASGFGRKRARITLTSGLLRALDERELRAVLAHELTHIRNGDMGVMTIAAIVVGGCVFFLEMMGRLVRASLEGVDRGPIRIDVRICGWFLGIGLLVALALSLGWLYSTLLNFALSRTREYLADAGAVELTKDPDAMIQALRKISGNSDIERATTSIMQMCVDNPRHNFFDLFATHPTVADRILAITRYARGYPPGPRRRIRPWARKATHGSVPSVR